MPVIFRLIIRSAGQDNDLPLAASGGAPRLVEDSLGVVYRALLAATTLDLGVAATGFSPGKCTDSVHFTLLSMFREEA